MAVTDRIEINPKIMMGKPVIRGTRIPVELILRKLSEGSTEADLFAAYPRLTKEDIQAALAYAADTLAHEETMPKVVMDLVNEKGELLTGCFVVVQPGRIRIGRSLGGSHVAE